MSLSLRRLLPLALGALLLLSVVPVTAAGSDLSPYGAENRVVGLLNAQRRAVGLVPLRVDSRLTLVARARSRDMASKGYFSHDMPDGRHFWDLMNTAGITWYGAGEILAWNTWGTLYESATIAAQQWHDSSGHYALVIKNDYNYVGIGLAIAPDGKKVWTGLLMKGPDRTGAWSRMSTTSLYDSATASTGSARGAKIRWLGDDYRLQVLTAGFRDFQIGRRVDGGSWTTIVTATTSSYASLTLYRGHRYEFQVRGRDRLGRYGRWSVPVTVTP